MPEKPSNPEKYNPYHVSVEISESELQTRERLAFVANVDNFSIIIGDTHDRILDRNNLSNQDYVGGDIWLEKNEITFISGSLGLVLEQYRDLISDAIRNWMNTRSR